MGVARWNPYRQTGKLQIVQRKQASIGNIKNNKELSAKGASYRTYSASGVQYATEYFLKTNVLKQYYGN